MRKFRSKISAAKTGSFFLRFLSLAIFLTTVVFVTGNARADILCKWLLQCFYESPAFKIRAVDKETSKPLGDVHAVAAWNQYGYHGSGGALMAIDAVSGVDGVLAFPKWGPLWGSSGGLVLNQDPIISLFKPGYTVLIINNAPGTDERARVRGLAQGGQTFNMEVFKGNLTEWRQQLFNAAFSEAVGGSSNSPKEVREALNRRRILVKSQAEKLPQDNKDVSRLVYDLDHAVRSFQEGKDQ